MSQLQSLRAWLICCRRRLRWQAVGAKAGSSSSVRGSVGSVRRSGTTDLFCRGIGGGTDVVGKEIYSFQDRGDRSCTLRPEGTASVVRAALQRRLARSGCSKLCTRGRCFAKRPQAGRQRQFRRSGGWLGAERAKRCWGDCSGLGLAGQSWHWWLATELNSLGTSEDRQAYRKALVAWLEQRLRRSIPIPRQGSAPIRCASSTPKTRTQALLADAPILADALSDVAVNVSKRCSEV